MTRRIRVFVVNEHTLVRHGLACLLRQEADLEVVGEAAAATQAVETIRTHETDVVLLTVEAPGPQGVETIRRMRRTHPGVAVVAVSTGARGAHAGALVVAGAAACVGMTDAPAVLLAAIRAYPPDRRGESGRHASARRSASHCP